MRCIGFLFGIRDRNRYLLQPIEHPAHHHHGRSRRGTCILRSRRLLPQTRFADGRMQCEASSPKLSAPSLAKVRSQDDIVRRKRYPRVLRSASTLRGVRSFRVSWCAHHSASPRLELRGVRSISGILNFTLRLRFIAMS
jgi:hypothetical protein